MTHAVDFLDRVDKIIVMNEGRIINQGTFEELRETDYFKIIIDQMKNTGKFDKKDGEKSESDKDESSSEDEDVTPRDYMSKEGTTITDKEEEEHIDVSIKTYLSFLFYSKKSALCLVLCIL